MTFLADRSALFKDALFCSTGSKMRDRGWRLLEIPRTRSYEGKRKIRSQSRAYEGQEGREAHKPKDIQPGAEKLQGGREDDEADWRHRGWTDGRSPMSVSAAASANAQLFLPVIRRSARESLSGLISCCQRHPSSFLPHTDRSSVSADSFSRASSQATDFSTIYHLPHCLLSQCPWVMHNLVACLFCCAAGSR